MPEPSQNTKSGSTPMNATFQDNVASQYPPGGTRGDMSESKRPVTQAMLDQPVDDVGKKSAVGRDPQPSSTAQGGATYDPAPQVTAQARFGSRRDASLAEATTVPGAEGSVVKGNKSAVADIKQEVGYLEGQLGSVAPQTRGY